MKDKNSCISEHDLALLLGVSTWSIKRWERTGAYTPASEWNPLFTEGTIHPGWTQADQDAWLTEFTAGGDVERYPDVFRTWIVPDDLDWTVLWNDSDAPGYRRYFEKDRQVMRTLLTSVFSKTSDVFRARRERLPVTIWRAFRGVATAADGSTRYGDSTTEHTASQNNPVAGKADWYLLQASAQVLTDGRLGFQLNSSARRNSFFRFEAGTEGAGTTPWSWNGLTDTGDARAYEMFWTVTVAADEDLYEYLALDDGGMAVNQYGPPLEMSRNASNEYGDERAANSLVSVPLTGNDRREVPPISPPGATRIYRNDGPRISARARMMANRHAKSDFEGEVELGFLDLSMQAGQYVDELSVPGDRPVKTAALVDTVVHDFGTQRTTVSLGSII